MNADRNFPEHLTFSQRYGYTSLPNPMIVEEISDDLRREIYNVVYRYCDSYHVDEYSKYVIAKILKKPEDEMSSFFSNQAKHFKAVILGGKFFLVLDLLEELINDRVFEEPFLKKFEDLFDQYAAAYWLDTSQKPYHFFPRASKEQGDATQEAIETIRAGGLDGSATHLHQAAEHINVGQYADSIVDSIHAVESVARTIAPSNSKSLGPALDSLENSGLLKHPALKEAFKKLYGYTSDEQGIRHALLTNDAPDVGRDEAVFMFGACASFAAYLVNKQR